MYQIRIHGRGGQGVVTGAEMLSIASFLEGHHAQAFPSFGSERTGAPVVAYCRIDEKEIRLREPIMQPDTVIIQDPTLLAQVDVLGGLTGNGYVLINARHGLESPALASAMAGVPAERVVCVNATDLALEHVGRAVPNVPLLGAFAAATGLIALESVCAAIREKFSGKVAEGNIAAASAAYHAVLGERVHA